MRIAQVILGDAWGGVSPEKLDKGIGGREGAMIRLAREWARRGHQVTCYVPTDNPTKFDEPKLELNAGGLPTFGDVYPGGGFHEYVPVNMVRQALQSFVYDAVVAWECPTIYSDSKIREIQRVRLVEMQCAHFVSKSEQDNASKFATGVCALSPWHRDFMLYDGLRMSENRLHVLPNGVDLSLYPWEPDLSKREGPKRFFYSSSPDRGLVHLLNMWPMIKGRWPEAELRVAYGVERLTEQVKWMHHKQGEMALDVAEGMDQDGVINVGTIGQKELAQIQHESTALLYPCDPIQPTETGCITVIEAMAAGAVPIITDADCLAEEFAEVAMVDRLPFNTESYLLAIETMLEDPELYRECMEKGRKFAESRQWKDIALRWLELFEADQERD